MKVEAGRLGVERVYMEMEVVKGRVGVGGEEHPKLRRHQKAIANLAISDKLIYVKIKLKIPFNNNF